jgi:TRAP transporter 4TM/12TM fusion protein
MTTHVSVQPVEDPEVRGSRFRSFKTMGQPWSFITRLFLIGLPPLAAFFIMGVPSYIGWSFMMEQWYGIMLAVVLCTIYLLVPPSKKFSMNKVPWYDVILAIASFAVGMYVALFYQDIMGSMGTLSPDRVIMGTLCIILVFEAVRRFTGWILPALVALFIFYALFNSLIPGPFGGSGISWPNLANSLYLDNNALLGSAMEVTAVTVLPFILFGGLLFAVGGGEFLTDFAMALFGRFRGGPAKISVVASSLFGTISGSAVANVTTVGVMTIPMMKKAGYKPHIAAAIEATASTGGQLMPPVMGAAAFLIPQYVGLPYSAVALAAFVPACLYYINIFMQVDLEAGKNGIKGLSKSQLPKILPTLKQMYLFIVPLLVLIVSLFILNLSAGKSAFLASASIIILSFARKETRFKIGWLVKGFEDSSRGILELTSVVAMAGFIIGVVTFTGVGFMLPLFLGQLAGHNVYFLLLIVAAAALVLGMGMPTVAVYILVAILLAPSLIQLGINPLGAHLFIFYWGMISAITPPVCFATFAAAAIAGSDSMKSGYSAMRVGILAYPIPFIFALAPALLLIGSPSEIVIAIITAIIGTLLLGAAVVGYLFRNISPWKRVLFGASGLGLLIPVQAGPIFHIAMYTNIIGGILAVLLVGWELMHRKETIRDITKPDSTV